MTTATIDHDQAMGQVAALEALLKHLPAKDQSFAISLIGSTKMFGPTSNRMYWIGELIERAQKNGAPGAPGAEPQQAQVGSFAKVIALFNLAKENLQKPKIRLQLASREALVLSVAGSKAKFPGTVDVTNGLGYGSGKWYGRVSTDGVFTKAMKAYEEMAEVEGILKRLGEAPAAVASEYGRLTGRCCFCNLKLTDPRSTAVGYGATCAKNYGLLDHWKESDALLETRDARSL
jgi:hypothetical protein